MNPVETHKDVTINERKFRIRKFDARTGSFMLFKIMGLLNPLVKSLDLNKLKDVKDPSKVDLSAFNFSSILAEIGNLSESDFNFVQEKCLRVCYEDLPAGMTRVLNDDGHFGVVGLEEDTMTVLALTVHTIIFNLKGFFGGSLLASMLGGLSTTFPLGS